MSNNHYTGPIFISDQDSLISLSRKNCTGDIKQARTNLAKIIALGRETDLHIAETEILGELVEKLWQMFVGRLINKMC